MMHSRNGQALLASFLLIVLKVAHVPFIQGLPWWLLSLPGALALVHMALEGVYYAGARYGYQTRVEIENRQKQRHRELAAKVKAAQTFRRSVFSQASEKVQ